MTVYGYAKVSTEGQTLAGRKAQLIDPDFSPSALLRHRNPLA